MLAYAANRPVIAGRRPSPNAMLVVIGAHVALIAVAMSAKMDLPSRIDRMPTIVDFIQEDDPPPPNPVASPVRQAPREPTFTRPDPAVANLSTGDQVLAATPSLPDFGDLIGPPVDPQPVVQPTPRPTPVKAGPQLLTPASELKPPYPQSKLLSEEEAVLKLRLTIDERGRVVAVEPLGRTDPAFLAAARRHLLAHWRYRPASADGRAVASSAVITLRFELDG